MWPLRKTTGTELSLPTGEKIRVHIDREVDAATIVLSDERVVRTVRMVGVGFVDLDSEDHVVSIELLNLSKQIEAQRKKQEPPPRSPAEDLLGELRKSVSGIVDRARETVAPG